MQPFSYWHYYDQVNASQKEWGGEESREFIIANSTGTRTKVSIIPNKRDGQFIFRGAISDDALGWHTSNDLVWITLEENTPP